MVKPEENEEIERIAFIVTVVSICVDIDNLGYKVGVWLWLWLWLCFWVWVWVWGLKSLNTWRWPRLSTFKAVPSSSTTKFELKLFESPRLTLTGR